MSADVMPLGFSRYAATRMVLLSVSQSSRNFTVVGGSWAIRLNCTALYQRAKQTKKDTDKHNYHQEIVTMPGKPTVKQPRV